MRLALSRCRHATARYSTKVKDFITVKSIEILTANIITKEHKNKLDKYANEAASKTLAVQKLYHKSGRLPPIKSTNTDSRCAIWLQPF